MEFIDSEEKEKIARSFQSIKFKFYSGFDIRILVASLCVAVFIFFSPFIVISLNKGNMSDYFNRMADPIKNYDVIVISCLVSILLLIAVVQLIRMNLINSGISFETDDHKKILIINGWLHKKYIINGKAYIEKKESALHIRRKEKSPFETLLSYFSKANVYKIEKNGKTIYDTKLLNVNNNWTDWFIETGLSSLPNKYVRLKFKEGTLVNGILNGSQRQCATYFKFGKIDKSIKLPDCIKNIKK